MRICIDESSKEFRGLGVNQLRSQLLQELGWTPDTDVGAWDVNKIMAVARVLSCTDKEATYLECEDTFKPMLNPTHEFAAILLLRKALQASDEKCELPLQIQFLGILVLHLTGLPTNGKLYCIQRSLRRPSRNFELKCQKNRWERGHKFRRVLGGISWLKQDSKHVGPLF